MPQLTLPSDCDEIILPETQQDLWVTVNNIDVHIVRTDEGVVVDMWPLEQGDSPIATTYAFFVDAEHDLDMPESSCKD